MPSPAGRLIAIALFLSACAGGSLAGAATPVPARIAAAEVVVADEVVMAELVPVPENRTGLISFGVAYDPETLEIPKPLTRFKRTYPTIAWSAVLTRGVPAAFVTWVVVSQSESGAEEVLISEEEVIDDPDLTILVNSGDLASLVDNLAGTYVMRYVDSRETLAEGTFRLVK
jgi:hypothetical protein